MDSLRAVAAVVVVAFGLCLIALLVVASAKPAVAVRFLGAFASSARAHLFRYLGLYVLGAFVFGVLLLYAVFAGGVV